MSRVPDLRPGVKARVKVSFAPASYSRQVFYFQSVMSRYALPFVRPFSASRPAMFAIDKIIFPWRLSGDAFSVLTANLGVVMLNLKRK